MEWSSAFVNSLVILQILLCAAIASAAINENSPWCNVTLNVHSISAHIPCDVNLTRCDERVQSLSLFSPPVNNLLVSVEMLQDKATDEYLGSLASMRWNLPDQSESLIGFLVHLKTLDGFSNKCYLLRVPWTATTDNPEFGFYLPLQTNNYSVRVHSKVESSLVHGSQYTVPRRTLVIKDRKKAYRNSPAFWITDLVVCSNSCSKSMTISFELAPDAYNFGVYTVLLRQGSTVKFKRPLPVINGQRQGTVFFGNLTSGNYTIAVSPENTDPGLCLCRCGQLTSFPCGGGKWCLDSCTEIVSNTVAIDNVIASDCYLTTDDPLLPTKITGIAIGCFLATGLIALIVWMLLRPKHIDIDVHALKKQEVFLLYLTDHPLHYDVVHHLIHFLNHHCKCSVRTMHDDAHLISQNPFRYIQNALVGSSKILLINSYGIANSTQCEQSVSSNPLDPMVQRFLECLHQRIDENENHKLMVARFDYTEINDTAKHINYRQHEYLLMREVELLILHIHGYEKRKGRCVHHIRDIQKSFNDSPEGTSLSDAMSLMMGLTVNDWLNSFDSPVQEPDLSDSTDGEREAEGPTSTLIANDHVWERAPESIVDVRGSIVEIYDSELSGEFHAGELFPDRLELLHFPLIPPSSDSSSLDSDCEPQLWSNEINADFDAHNSRLTGWTT